MQPFRGSITNPIAEQHADIYGYHPMFGDWEYSNGQQALLDQLESPSDGDVKTTSFSLFSDSYQRCSYEQPLSVGSVRPGFGSQPSNSEQGYSYGEPPSVGAVRQIFLSQPSAGDQIYRDGQPPRLNDLGKRAKNKSQKKDGLFFLKKACKPLMNILRKLFTPRKKILYSPVP
ncbi:unnamed protein product [Lactuca saligna]|uniref:Uncharacterized protein n=1 Tax=Lactuca saligna TaxID=75948 RepID=A0AA36A2N0_LACSI|nr:unnamed protein product [Lactuca saligna]